MSSAPVCGASYMLTSIRSSTIYYVCMFQKAKKKGGGSSVGRVLACLACRGLGLNPRHRAWLHRSVISALRRWRQKNQKFKVHSATQ